MNVARFNAATSRSLSKGRNGSSLTPKRFNFDAEIKHTKSLVHSSNNRITEGSASSAEDGSQPSSTPSSPDVPILTLSFGDAKIDASPDVNTFDLKIDMAMTPTNAGNGHSSSASQFTGRREVMLGNYKISDRGTEVIENEQSGEMSKLFGSILPDELSDIDFLGAGACGRVCRSVHCPTLRLVAVKTINVEQKSNARQLTEEINALSMASSAEGDGSEHIVKLFGAHITDDFNVALVLEYMDGGSLEGLVAAGGCTDERLLCNIAHDVLKGLSFLHGKGIIHCDIKPSNLLINHEGICKITDFGLAKVLTGDSAETVEALKTFAGTTNYMSPERLEGKAYAHPSDVYSFGLSLYACAVGRHPFEGRVQSYWDLVELAKESSTLHTLPEDRYSDLLCSLVSKCILYESADRPSASEMLGYDFIQAFEEGVQNAVGDTNFMAHANDLPRVAAAVISHFTSNKNTSSGVARKVFSNLKSSESEDSRSGSLRVIRSAHNVLDGSKRRKSTAFEYARRKTAKLISTIPSSLLKRFRSGHNRKIRGGNPPIVQSKSSGAQNRVSITLPQQNIERLARQLRVNASKVEAAFSHAALNMQAGLVGVKDSVSIDTYDARQNRLCELLGHDDASDPEWETKHEPELRKLNFVFLGGSCGDTDWRRGFVTALHEANVQYYNPQRSDYKYEIHAPMEARAKIACKTLIYVIESGTRATAALVEAASAMGRGRESIFAIAIPPRSLEIDGRPVSEKDHSAIVNGRMAFCFLTLQASHVRPIDLGGTTFAGQNIQYMISDSARHGAKFARAGEIEHDVYVGGNMDGDGSLDLLKRAYKGLKERFPDACSSLDLNGKDIPMEEIFEQLTLMQSSSRILMFVVSDDARAYDALVQAAAMGAAGRHIVIVMSESVRDIEALLNERERKMWSVREGI